MAAHTHTGECIHGYTTLPRVAACMHAHLEGVAGERGCGDADVHHGRVGVICEHIGVLHAAPLCHVTQTVQVPDVYVYVCVCVSTLRAAFRRTEPGCVADASGIPVPALPNHGLTSQHRVAVRGSP